MEQSDDTAADPGAPPVFVDDTGRRRARARRVGRILVLGFVGYLALLAVGFARDPKLGALRLPTFGLPGLVHPQSAPTVLSEATTRPSPDIAGAGAGAGAGGDETLNLVPSKATRGIDISRRATPAGPAGGGGAGPGAGQPTPGPAPAAPATGQPAPTTTTSTTPTTVPANPGHGSKGSTTTTSTTPTTTPTTTTTPPGQANAASAKGPDGSGPPGQLRRATTSTTAPGAGG